MDEPLLMKDFLKGRKSVPCIDVVFSRFVPCIVGRYLFRDRLKTAASDEGLCTTSDEAFTLLLLENSYDRWVDLYDIKKKTSQEDSVSTPRKRIRSDKRTLYTNGGVKYHFGDGVEGGTRKGWGPLGIERFNVLYKAVALDRKQRSDVVMNWKKTQVLTKQTKRRKIAHVSAGPEAVHELWGEADLCVTSAAAGGVEKTTGLCSEDGSVASGI